jgi:hypothetical protein
LWTWLCISCTACWNLKKSPVVCSIELRTKSGPRVLFWGSSWAYQLVMSVRFLRSG